MTNYIKRAELQVSEELVNFLEQDVLAGLNFNQELFWSSFAEIIEDLMPQNKALLEKREHLQTELDQWCKQNQGKFDVAKQRQFLSDLGYLVEEGDEFKITTENVDDEIAVQAGPQLVVPAANARFSLNATNARWGSLYDALYGSDVIPETNGAEKVGAYNPVRGDKVIAYGRDFLDQFFPLTNHSHAQVTAYALNSEGLMAKVGDQEFSLQTPEQCIGYQGEVQKPSAVLLKHNDLHAVIEIDPTSNIGATDLAGVKDITLEAAVTTIQDFEDSVAAVDAEDKVNVYRNWLGLMRGDLEDTFEKGGHLITRQLVADKHFQKLSGEELVLPGRSLLFCRNVGHLMTNPAILNAKGDEIPEGIMDAMISSLIAIYDLRGMGKYQNSRKGSVYIVKPKMHGPEEVAFANELFNRVEDALGLERHTLKMGIMDEERRTTVNLKECIRQAQHRVVFINTGFLDRTGDEIHTSMQLGPMAPKSEIKLMPWIQAYEDWNVDIGIECGLPGRAQIGKGMWAMPDELGAMVEQKMMHPKAGANTAWVPSPVGATLHAMHYHQVDVKAVQTELANRERASLDDILSVPLAADISKLSAKEIQQELDNNAQGILGYVVRWVDQGVGCSKVPDIHNVGLMEDRATLRISSQHIGNWLEHGVCDREQVVETFKRMAAVVDQQNSGDVNYQPMADNFEQSLSFKAALDLVFEATTQPSGYTEPLLHSYRLKLKASA